jgi:hypothetical protein
VYALARGNTMECQGKLYVKDLTKQDTPFTELQNSPIGFFDGIEIMDE